MDKNKLYWAYNLPLQLWPTDDGKDARILNYMPRKERCCDLVLSEILGEQTREEFFETTAIMLENLAKQFREAKTDINKLIYYHDSDMEG